MSSSPAQHQAIFNACEIRAATFLRHIEIHDTLGSTNDRAGELALDAAIELPALVVARLQTAGRGRGRNAWWACDGALTFSLLLDPATMGISQASWPQLSLATAVAVCDALRCELNACGLPIGDCGLESTFPNPKSEIRIPKLRLGIKWPNDVFLDGRKVCGILIESPGGAPPAKDRLTIGIGINVNNSWRNAPRDAGANGTALCDATGRPHGLQRVLVGVLTAIASRIAQLRTHDMALIREWQRLDLLAGQTVLVESDGRRIEGKCLAIAYDGALVLDAVFEQHRLYSGTVRPPSHSGPVW